MKHATEPAQATFSVIIPVHNRASVVECTLHSVACQTSSDFELILIDNGSTDGTLDVLRHFADRHRDMRIDIAEEPTPGACAARNRGLEIAHGEWVVFFDSDDVMHPQLIDSYAHRIASCGGKTDVVIAGARLIATDGHVLRRLPQFVTDCTAQQILHSMLSTQCYAVRRNLVIEAGGWDATLPRWQDYELGIRLLLHGARVTAVREVMVDVMVSGENSITGTSFSRQHSVLEHVLDMVESHIKESHPAGERRLLRLVNYRRLSLAAIYTSEGANDLAAPLLERAIDGMNPSPVMRRLLMWLYRRISTGKRGSARIAHLLIR